MAHKQSGLSRTLPKDFTFNAADLDDPQTPKQPATEPKIPPPPHHSTCRFQRPRINIFTEPNRGYLGIGSPDFPLPSIEFSHESAPSNRQWLASHEEWTPSNRLRVPGLGVKSAPRTPPAQIRTTPSDALEESNWTTEQVRDYGNSIQRPQSACSDASDSSVSSCGTFNSHPSFGGSCTSPESDIQDPFITHSESERKQLLKTPSKPGKSSGKRLGTTTRTECRWTPEMDNHLWNTYQIYLQDPTITPFKMVPGSIPPLGVSHRVAREAKRTWSKTKTSSFQSKLTGRQIGGFSLRNEGSIGMTGYRSGSITPTARPTWPRSESSTRRRLKELCKRKFSIAPHYQRLLQSRSPSPFHDLFPRRTSRPPSGLDSSHSNSASFATRDLGVSLASSSAPHELTQLAVEEKPQVENEQDWFNNPVEASNEATETEARQGSNASCLGDPGPAPRLGSPFMYNTWGPSSSNRRLRPTTPINQCDTFHATGSRLRSPGRVELLSNAPKRRALHKFDDDLGPDSRGVQRNIQDLFRGNKNKDMSQRRVRLRNRGVTVGGVVGSRGRVEQLFTPPSPVLGPNKSSDDIQANEAETHRLSVPEGDGIKRLASPFKLDGLKPQVTSPRHAPSLSDPFISSSLGEQDTCATPTRKTLESHDTDNSKDQKPYNDSEPGISDAERIRRQILNRSFP